MRSTRSCSGGWFRYCRTAWHDPRSPDIHIFPSAMDAWWEKVGNPRVFVAFVGGGAILPVLLIVLAALFWEH